MATITKEQLDEAAEGSTLPDRFLQTVAAHPDQVALRARAGEDAPWVELTYAQYAEQVAQVAAGLEALGVGPGDRVVLMMRNCIDFHVIDMAVLFRGATAVSIYNSSAPEQIAYLAGHCRAKVAVVEDIGFLERLLKVRHELPALEMVAILSDPDGQAGAEVLGRADLFEGRKAIDLQEAAGLSTPGSLATVIYTSGTTGPPKGVMLTHRNVVWTAECYLRLLDVDPVGFRVVSYLPMAHIAERMTSHYLGAIGGYEVTMCPEAGQMPAYVRAVRPNIMFGVPRVWEKLHAGVQAALGADPERKQAFDGAVATAIPLVERRTWGTATAEDEQTLAAIDAAAFQPVRALLGLDAVEFALTGAAPIPAELITWYRTIGVPLSEIYGMSESTGIISWEPTRVKPGCVGVPFPGVEVFLAEDGEVCCRGGNVFDGYLDDPEKTAEAVDDTGALHSGDIGTFDDDGYLRIVDRKKELIITAGGKNISPANLESALRTLPLVGQACAIGDQRPFVSALVVLDPEIAPVWAREQGIAFEGLADLASNPDVIAEVERGVHEVMGAFNNAEAVKKVKVLGEEWLPDSDELTPTSKLKRRGIHARYADEINALYT